MTVAELLIATNDPRLAQQVERLAGSVKDCYTSCIPLPKPEDVCQTVEDTDPALVIVHHACADTTPSVQAFLELAADVNGVPIIVISEPSQATVMTQWLRLGARECLSRVIDLARLPRLIDSVTFSVRQGCCGKKNWLHVDGIAPYCLASRKSKELAERVGRIVDRDANLVITGESGTGKSHLAKLIHSLSHRLGQPFLTVNCAAVPETLAESQLFGHKRGAFTSAIDQTGLFSRVGKGTLVLDEVEALTLSLQAKLLHAVDDGSFTALGSRQPNTFEGRLIVITNKDLDELVAAGHFRNDLYFRLNVLELNVAPLRQRRCEIRYLAEHYISESSKRNNGDHRRISGEVMKVLQAYDWPGNVRQLHNVLEQASCIADTEEIRVTDIPASIRETGPGSERTPVTAAVGCCDDRLQGTRSFEDSPDHPLAQGRAHGESEVLAKVLEAHGHNRTAAARALGISRTALYKRMHKLGFI